MGLPPGITPGIVTTRDGIPLHIVPSSDPSVSVEVWRKTTTASTYALVKMQTAQLVNNTPFDYFDALPLSTFSYSYKARSVANGKTPSTFTAAVTGKPIRYTAMELPTLAYSGLGVGVSQYLSTAAPIKFGSAGNPKSVKRTLRVPAAAARPDKDTDTYSLTGAYLQPRVAGAGGTLQAYAPVQLPIGAKPVAFRARGYRSSATNDVFSVTLSYQIDGTVTALGSKASTAINWQTLTSTAAITDTVSSGKSYYVGVLLLGFSTGSHARIAYWEVDYTIDNLNLG